MSRGLGAFQWRLLRAVHEGIEQVNVLCWHLATAGGHLTEQGDITGSYYSQFRKALKALAPEHLVLEQRFLTGFDELERYYPSRSRLASVKNLREKLLPELRNYVESRPPRYGLAENERHLLQHLPEEQRASAKQRWEELRDLLFQCARSHPDSAVAETAFELRLKGDWLFLPDARFSSADSLGQLLARARGLLPSELLRTVIEFYRAIWPAENRRQAKLKSQLIWVADFRSSKEPTLQEDFLKWLSLHRRRSVRALVLQRGKPGSFSALRSPMPTEILKQVLLRDAVRRFQFVRLAASRGVSDTSGPDEPVAVGNCAAAGEEGTAASVGS